MRCALAAAACPHPGRSVCLCGDIAPLVNAARTSRGLRPVSCVSELDDAAQRHSIYQANRDSMSHTGQHCH